MGAKGSFHRRVLSTSSEASSSRVSLAASSDPRGTAPVTLPLRVCSEDSAKSQVQVREQEPGPE